MCIWNVKKEDRRCDYCSYGGGCEDRESKRAGRVMWRMKNMDVGEWLFFPIGRWNACRSSASALKKNYGAVFEVHRVEDRIMVERIN